MKRLLLLPALLALLLFVGCITEPHAPPYVSHPDHYLTEEITEPDTVIEDETTE